MTRKQLENRKTKDLSPFIFSTMNQVIKHITKAKTQNKTTNSKYISIIIWAFPCGPGCPLNLLRERL
ncbi:hypothetical protein FLA105534_04094 [Flavobacterium bizetiae]|uniref:Uncharacterized protein n=1 Tax=Flavobacterium bizetiae TaxID=2704140 RepID=A0A6J4GVR2_9FLAO|nr:hypothetical protein FLA105534_04094 [Flavobacterium bizetiae]